MRQPLLTFVVAVALTACGGGAEPGADGPAGPPGADGSVGPEGQAGPQGEPGADGAPGPGVDPREDSDLDGWVDWVELAAGSDPNDDASVPADLNLDGVADVLVGPVGPAGAVGPEGPAGSPGPIGPQGPEGLQGAVGLQGEAGPQGDPGPQGLTGADGAIGPQGPEGSQGPQGPQGEAGATGLRGPAGLQGETGPRPSVALGGGLVGTGEPASPLAVSFAGNGAANTAARSDHDHDATYLRQSVLSEAAATTLSGGGNADLLHTHAAQPSPWFECGSLAELVGCQLPGFAVDEYEYGIKYNTQEALVVTCSLWNHGRRVYNRHPYFVSADNPSAGMGYGGTMFYTGTLATDDDCAAGTWRHQYWNLNASNVVVPIGGNGCTNLPISCRERM